MGKCCPCVEKENISRQLLGLCMIVNAKDSHHYAFSHLENT